MEGASVKVLEKPIIEKLLDNNFFCDEISSYSRECRNCSRETNKAKKQDPSIPKIKCSECPYVKKDWGQFDDDKAASIPPYYYGERDLFEKIPIKGKTKVSIHSTNQIKFEQQILTASKDLSVLKISYIRTDNLDILENFSKLEIVLIDWCNKLERFWDFSKTPNLKVLSLGNLKISNLDFLKKAKSIEFLRIVSEYGAIDNLSFLEELGFLNYFILGTKVTDLDIMPIVKAQSLKKAWISAVAFPIEAYAMLEARRPNLMINIKDGLYGQNRRDTDLYTIGKRNFKNILYDISKEKLEEYKQKYFKMMQKYKSIDYMPPVVTKKDPVLPTEEMKVFREVKDNEIKAVEMIEKTLKVYHSKMVYVDSKTVAKKIVKEYIGKINAINSKCSVIETEESNNICDFLSSYFKEKWHEDLEEVMEENRDW